MEEQNPYTVDCPHRHGRYVTRTLTNGSLHYGKQCTFCGLFKFVKKESIPSTHLATIGEYDPSVRDEYHKRRHELSQTQREEIRQERFQDLAEYYQSDHWRSYRANRLELNQKLFGGLCEMCRVKPPAHVHHFTYERLWHEWIFDCGALCLDCHEMIHPHMRGEE